MSTALIRAAGFGALVIFLAFLTHTFNAFYFEPQVLGFTDVPSDYARAEKLRDALGSLPWTFSGIGHALSGFACVVIGLAAFEMFGQQQRGAALTARAAGTIAGVGFLLTGISDLSIASGVVPPLAALNEGADPLMYAIAGLVRNTVNCLAIVGIGWLALQISYCGLKTGQLPKALCWFGYVVGFSGVVIAFVFIPAYMPFILIWSLFLGISLLRRA